MKRVFAFIGFSIALTLIMLNFISFSAVKYIIAVFSVLFLLSLIFPKTRQAIVLPITIGSIIFACLLFTVNNYSVYEPQQQLLGEEVTAQVRIVEPCRDTGGDYYIYTVKSDYIDKPGSVQQIKFKLLSKEILNADYYDDLRCNLKFIAFNSSPIDSYGQCSDGIFLTAILEKCELVNRDSVKPVGYYLLKMRIGAGEILDRYINTKYSNVLGGMLFGDKDNIDVRTLADFKICGVSHCLAVSGLHIGIVYLALSFILIPLRKRERLQSLITIIFILFYVGLAGFSKSVVRASVMLIVMLVASMINKKSDTLNSLGFAVFIICLNPYAVTDPSAVLTVCAMLGVLCIYPEFLRLFHTKHKVLEYVYTSVSMSVSVILATIIPTWFFFKGLSVLSIVVNIIFIPFVQLGVISGLLTILFSPIPFLAFVPSQLAKLSVFLMMKTARFFASRFSFLFLDISDDIVIFSAAAILLLVGIMLVVNKEVNFKIISVFIAATIVISSAVGIYQVNTTVYVKVLSTGAVFVYDEDNVIAFDIDSGTEEYIFNNMMLARGGTGLVINDRESEYELKNKSINLIYNDEIKNTSFGDNIILTADDNIFVKVYNYNFKISKDCVIILDNKIFRDISKRFGVDKDNVICVKENAQLIMKEE